MPRTIPLAFRRGAGLPLPLHPILPFPQPLQKDNNPLPRTMFLPPLSKGGGLTARHKLLLCCVLLATRPPFLFTKLFCRQDGGIALHLPTFSFPQPLQKDNNPSLSTTSLPPLSKGGGLTERHKLLLCCFLLVIRLPFQFIKLFCRQDGGIAIQSFASHYPSRFP